MGHLLGHRPAKFPRFGRFVLVRLAQQQVSPGNIGPSRRRRVDFLEHGERQPRAAGREAPPRLRVRDEFGHGLIAPPLRPGRQPALGIGHVPHLGRQLGRYGFHPRLPRDRQARVDEDVAAHLTDEGTRRSQQRPGPAMSDEDRGLARLRCALSPRPGASSRAALPRPCRSGPGRPPHSPTRPGPPPPGPSWRTPPAGYEPAAPEQSRPHSYQPSGHAAVRALPRRRLATPAAVRVARRVWPQKWFDGLPES